MKILFLGDIVGKGGRKLITSTLPRLTAALQIDLVVANAENASGGSGLNGSAYRQLCQAGVTAFTMGDHIYRQREILTLFEKQAPICKPANFPPDSPGAEYLVIPTPFGNLGVISLMGRTFMRAVDCPFRAADRVLEQLMPQAKMILADVHAEATSDKQLLGRYLSGRVSAVFGTHTHVPTADARIFPNGTAFITDVGMTGPYESVIGREYKRVLAHTLNFVPTPFDVAEQDLRLSGALVDIDPETGHATHVELFHKTAEEVEALIAQPAES